MKKADSKQDQIDKFLAAVESAVIDLAEREGVMIRVERDTRGRYSTFIVRAVSPEREGGERVVLLRKVNGVKVK